MILFIKSNIYSLIILFSIFLKFRIALPKFENLSTLSIYSLLIFSQIWAHLACFCFSSFLAKTIVLAELSTYFLSENKDKLETPHKYFLNFPCENRTRSKLRISLSITRTSFALGQGYSIGWFFHSFSLRQMRKNLAST